MTRGLVLLPILLAALAACGGASLPPAQPTEPPAPTPIPALAAGTYQSSAFEPTVTYTVPEGWVLAADTGLYLTLRPVENDLIGVHLFRDPKAASQDSTCPAAAEPGVGGGAQELADWIAARPGLVVSTPAMTSIGGLSGIQLDVGLRADWTQSCPFANGAPAVPLFNSPAIDHWVVVGNERLRLFLLDLPGGGTVVVDLDAFDGSQIEDLLARSASIVRSLQFEGVTAPASPAPASGAPATPAPASQAPVSPAPATPAAATPAPALPSLPVPAP